MRNKHGLIVHEWIAVIVLCLMLVTIGIYSQRTKCNESTLFAPFTVQVLGAVTEPKTFAYSFPIEYHNLLSQVELLPDADTTHIENFAQISKDLILIIPRKGLVSVYINGAVKQPQVISVPLGTRVADLLRYISMEESANTQFLKRRKRLLKQGEIITIPHR